MMNYKLFPYPYSPGLIEEVLAVPLTQMKPRSGHPGSGYNKGWIGDLQTTRLSYPDVGEHIYRAIHQLNSWFGSSWIVNQVMVNRLGPQSALAKHRDGFTGDYRFHLPIITNEWTFWWDEVYQEHIHFRTGFWYGPVPYQGVLHSMVNQNNSARYHLIADLRPPS